MTLITVHRPEAPTLGPGDIIEALRRRLHAPVRLTRAGLRWVELDATAPPAAVRRACESMPELKDVRWEVAP